MFGRELWLLANGGVENAQGDYPAAPSIFILATLMDTTVGDFVVMQ